MSEINEINVGADFAQLRRLVLHWYRMYLKQVMQYKAREKKLLEVIKCQREALEFYVEQQFRPRASGPLTEILIEEIL